MIFAPPETAPPLHHVQRFIPKAEADLLFGFLESSLPWGDRQIIVYGKTHRVPRKLAFFGPRPYRYSGIEHPAARLPEVLDELRQRVVVHTGLLFDTVLCNRYADGDDHVSWHADADYAVGQTDAVASLSFGATRDFCVRRRATAGPGQRIPLFSGDLVVMPPGFQREWDHRVPRTTQTVDVRINLTFRSMA